MTDQSTAKPMTQPERNALVKVVKSRFDVTRRFAKQRRNELRSAIFERLTEENRAKVETAEGEMAELLDRAKRLSAEAEALVAKHRRKGVQWGSAKMKSVYTDARFTETGLRVETNPYSASGTDFNSRFATRFYVEDIAEQVEREYARLEAEYELGEVALAKREQEVIEEILLGGVNPDATREFLERVPTLDSLPNVEEAVAQISGPKRRSR